MLCVFVHLLSLSSNCRDFRTMLFSFVLAQRNLKVFIFSGIITNCDSCLFQQYYSQHQMYHQFHSKYNHYISLCSIWSSSFTSYKIIDKCIVCPDQFHLTKSQRFFRGRGTGTFNLPIVHVSAQQPFSKTFIVPFIIILLI